MSMCKALSMSESTTGIFPLAYANASPMDWNMTHSSASRTILAKCPEPGISPAC